MLQVKEESPMDAVINATQKQKPNVVISMSSRERVFTTLNISLGKIYLLKSTIPAIIAVFLVRVIRGILKT